MTESPLRRAQLIHTFGVGALYVTNEKVGLIGAGLDFWFQDPDGKNINDRNEFLISERRLAKRLNVDHFMKPPDYRLPIKSYVQNSSSKNLKIRIPFLRFPQWHYCINRKCSTMRRLMLTENTNKPKCLVCNTRMVQVPLVSICEDGHIDDFPWNEFVHRTLTPPCSGDKLKFKFTGVPSLAGQSIYCEGCNKRRTLATALGKNISIEKGVAFPCNGRRTWLDEEGGESCNKTYGGSLRSSLKVYFSKTAKSIYIPEDNSNINPELEDIFLDRSWSSLITTIKGLVGEKIKSNFFRDFSTINNQVLKGIIESQNNILNIKDRLAKFTDDELNSCIDKYINNEEALSSDTSELEFGTEEEEDNYRSKEYKLFLKTNNIKNFETKPININNYEGIISKYFKNITLVHKLVETSAMYGFTRKEFQENLRLEEYKNKLRLYPISNFNETWLPATQTAGEGIFLEIKPDLLESWEQKSEIIERMGIIKSNYLSSVGKSDEDTNELPVARKVLLHTLSHILINQLVYDCGYGASSLKERIYSSLNENNNMSGILIYTVGGDSEGSMGGLVRMGRPGFFEGTFKRALIKSSWCSVDPVCSEIGSSTGQGPNSSNLSACHNCALVPETSCEMFNSFLDRTLVTGDYKNRSIGFMGEEIKNF